jgi:cell division septum initiation protein DivIVA
VSTDNTARPSDGVDIHAKLDELTEMVETARSMPMSASCIVNRTDVLTLLDEVREMLPSELREAQFVIKDRNEVLEEGKRQAEQILADAERERDRLVSETEVVKRSEREADRIIDDANEEARRMQMEVDDYVDAKLANFEVVLNKVLTAVERGRDKLRGRQELDALGEPGALGDDTPLPG